MEHNPHERIIKELEVCLSITRCFNSKQIYYASKVCCLINSAINTLKKDPLNPDNRS